MLMGLLLDAGGRTGWSAGRLCWASKSQLAIADVPRSETECGVLKYKQQNLHILLLKCHQSSGSKIYYNIIMDASQDFINSEVEAETHGKQAIYDNAKKEQHSAPLKLQNHHSKQSA